MSKPRRDLSYLADIEEAIQRILVYTKDLTYSAFLEDDLVQDATLRNIQVIGQATKRVSDTLRDSHPAVPWREMAGMRDKVVHDYFKVDYAIVWGVVQIDLPAVLPQVQAILRAIEEGQ